jgi:hypothetical protein
MRSWPNGGNDAAARELRERKQVSPSMQELLPESDFRLFAVTVRYPQALARQTTLTQVQPGVYEVRHFTGVIRVVVIRELPQEEHDALLHLFSARTNLLQYGATHYRLHSEETSTLLLQLFRRYHLEAKLMPDALGQFAEETIENLVKTLPAKWRLAGLSPDELLAALSPETRAALAQRLKDEGPPPATNAPEAGPGL